ncbi:hypothetical protein RchiOBHm_Chr4g0410771 [Rosa chinensis]|uniref:Voltage-gated hydrogen channel 1 n=1 Tax=Rosa chinensis TaxID=74649 RepID=A0A2P6QVH4_ROSCH|nr:voltage-gated hydrogen channel 1 [Rosa chinensis]XP_024192263.1 voltage-gated hydrogen channel 1 [Rosa chinensis]XP_040375201.1 voltage-gated hydrogen channel 1 [Rosa chinensis]XP_040375202.1 voltage-gated hydrogen channel 1 [Rosa chinensis]PRQ38166.1 hypothetical protein RchiOBHm_Chr4g0410771 [Rosa chinensis]
MAFNVTPKHKNVKLALHASISFPKNGSSSQIQQQRPSTENSFSIESVESSIRSLLRSWYRRQKWQVLFNSTPPQELDRAPWRTHLASFLESTPVHAVSLGLLIIDLIFTILELSSSILATSCRPNENHKATEEIWYHWVGVAILTLLSAKTIALAVGLGTTFVRRPGYVIDGIVLMGALGLEVFLDKIEGGLLVVVSLWRVIRVVESAFELSDEAIEAQIEGLVCQFEMLREENRRLLETIAEKDQIIQKLQEDSDQCTCCSSRKSLPYE